MKVLDRVVVTLAACVLLLLGVVALALVAGWNGLPWLGDLVLAARSDARVEAGLLGLLSVAVGLYLLSLGWQRAAGADDIRLEGERGDVRISLRAVESLVFAAATEVRGISEVVTKLSARDGELVIDMSVQVSSERPMPDVARDVQERVASHVNAIVGVPVASIGVDVRSVSRPQRQRVE